MRPYSQILFSAALFSQMLPVAAASEPSAPATGKVLLLATGQVIEGDITRAGDHFRIVRDGGTTWLPADRAHALCADLKDAYRFLRQRTDARDANARVRLARWCDRVGLREQAIAEANGALGLQPQHLDAQRLLKQIQAANAVVPAAAAAPAAPPPQPAPVEVSGEALKRFVTKVQPVLMNACAACHASPSAKAFQLHRVADGSLSSRTATQHNLAAAMAQIDRSRPAQSKLLTNATTAHGGVSSPPLRDRNATPYRLLEEWVGMVAGNANSVPPAAAPTTTPEIKPVRHEATDPAAVEPKKPATDDPFDPAIFNRQHHPEPVKPPGPAPG